MEPLQPSTSRRTMISSLLLLLAVSAAVLFLGRAATPETMWLATAICAAGVLGMAGLLAGSSPHPRWAHWGSATLLAISVVAAAWWSESPASWAAHQRPNLWMLPWFVSLTAGPWARARRGVCASERVGGWALVGASLLFPAILLSADWIGSRIG